MEGARAQRHIRDAERDGKAKLLVFNEGTAPQKFWEPLGGKAPVPPAIEDKRETPALTTPVLLRVSDAGGEVKTTEVARGKLSSTMLDGDDVFLLDNGPEIFVWVGGDASADERKAGMQKGVGYVASGGRPNHTRVTKFVEGAQPAAFEALFTEWSGARQPLLFACSDATGELEVSPICEPGQASLEEEDVFILMTDLQLFVWHGSASNEIERAGALEAAKKLLATAGEQRGAALSLPIIEVASGEEPVAFTELFASWDPALKTWGDPYKEMRDKGEEKKKAAANKPKSQKPKSPSSKPTELNF